jgi:hypothetical protein
LAGRPARTTGFSPVDSALADRMISSDDVTFVMAFPPSEPGGPGRLIWDLSQLWAPDGKDLTLIGLDHHRMTPELDIPKLELGQSI